MLTWRDLKNSKCWKDSLTPYLLSPDAGDKIFMWEVPSLYLEEKSIFISKDKGMLKKTEKVSPSKPPFSLVPLDHTLLSYHIFL